MNTSNSAAGTGTFERSNLNTNRSLKAKYKDVAGTNEMVKIIINNLMRRVTDHPFLFHAFQALELVDCRQG